MAKKILEFQVFEIEIPKKFFPKTKGNESRRYSNKLIDVLRTMHDIELRMEVALKQAKSIKGILMHSKRAQRPINYQYVREVGQNVEDFFYEYENYSLRLYIYRETLVKFLSEFYKIKKNNSIGAFQDDSLMKQIGISKLLSQFDQKNSVLGEIVEYRNKLTHKLENKEVKEKELESAIVDAEKKIEKVNKSLTRIMKLQSDIAKKVCSHKNEVANS